MPLPRSRGRGTTSPSPSSPCASRTRTTLPPATRLRGPTSHPSARPCCAELDKFVVCIARPVPQGGGGLEPDPISPPGPILWSVAKALIRMPGQGLHRASLRPAPAHPPNFPSRSSRVGFSWRSERRCAQKAPQSHAQSAATSGRFGVRPRRELQPGWAVRSGSKRTHMACAHHLSWFRERQRFLHLGDRVLSPMGLESENTTGCFDELRCRRSVAHIPSCGRMGRARSVCRTSAA